MTTIVTRAGKGSPLTHNEVDANFTNLNNDKVEGAASSTDNALVRFDGTGGKTAQDSAVTLDDNGVLTLPDAATPSAPSSGVSLFGKTAGGRGMPAFLGPDGRFRNLQPLLGRTHTVRWYPRGANATTVFEQGLAPGITGTATSQAVGTSDFYASTFRIGYLVTVAATNAVANWRSGYQGWTIGGQRAGEGGFFTVIRWGCSTGVATTTTRAFAGMRFDGNVGADSDPSSLTNIGVGMGWDNGDTNVQFIARGAGAALKVDLGSSFPRPSVDNTDVFEVVLYSPQGTTQSVSYEITNLTTGAVATGTTTTNLPASTTFGSPHIYMSVGGTSSVIGISVMHVEVESDY